MLLNELFEDVQNKVGSIPVVHVKTLPGPDYKTGRHNDYIGAGARSEVYQHNNTGGIVKYTHLGSLNDPSLKFINICLFRADNPWLPKYKNAKIYTDGKGYVLMSVGESLSGDLAERSWRNNPARSEFLRSIELSKNGQAEKERYINRFSDNGSLDFDDEERELIGTVWAANQLIGSNHESIKKAMHMFNDTDLLNALDILSHFPDYNFDMHNDNFMWRGNQLVINDPVFGDGD